MKKLKNFVMPILDQDNLLSNSLIHLIRMFQKQERSRIGMIFEELIAGGATPEIIQEYFTIIERGHYSESPSHLSIAYSDWLDDRVMISSRKCRSTGVSTTKRGRRR